MDTIEYEAPRVTVVGTLESVTQASSLGQYTDANYPVNTFLPSEHTSVN